MPENSNVCTNTTSSLSEKIAWPAEGIYENSGLQDYTWGYLIIDEKGIPKFDGTQTPVKKEIMAHWGHYLMEDSGTP